MVNNYFLRTLALAFTLVLSQSYAITMAQEEPTREITGPNGEPLWDYLFVQKPAQPTSEPVSTTANASDDEDLALDVLFDEEITPANAPLPEPLFTPTETSKIVEPDTTAAALPKPLDVKDASPSEVAEDTTGALLLRHARPKETPLPESLNTMSPEMTNWRKMESTTGIESMLPENTKWATPEEKQRYYDNLKMNTIDTTSPEAVESIRRMNTYE